MGLVFMFLPPSGESPRGKEAPLGTIVFQAMLAPRERACSHLGRAVSVVEKALGEKKKKKDGHGDAPTARKESGLSSDTGQS